MSPSVRAKVVSGPYFFFIMKHLKFLHVLHTNIAYDLNMCHKIDQRSKGRSQENCKTRDLVISLNEETL